MLVDPDVGCAKRARKIGVKRCHNGYRVFLVWGALNNGKPVITLRALWSISKTPTRQFRTSASGGGGGVPRGVYSDFKRNGRHGCT